MPIEVRKITKSYGKFTALRDCSFSVAQGEVLGLLGPNGAGKTTLLRLLLGFLRPTSGDAYVDGFHCYRQSLEVRKRVSYLPGDVRLFGNMVAGPFLNFLGELRGSIPHLPIAELAELLELDLTRKVSAMSTGNRQKLALVAAFAADTPVLILDEPTSNLDPSVRSTVAQLVQQAKTRGRTVLFSSHVLSEVEDVCDRVIILQAGQLVHVQPVEDLRRRHRIRVRFRESAEVPAHLGEGLDHQITADGTTVLETSLPLAPLLQWLAQQPVDDLTIEPAGLRAVYERFHPSRSQFGLVAIPGLVPE